MKKYKYYENIKNAVFTEQPCQFCGSQNDCLEGVYFERKNIDSVCAQCLEKEKTSVYIPEDIQQKIKKNKDEKIKELSLTPPVAWIQCNEWPVCCDDFMKYVGELEKSDLIEQSSDEEYIDYFKNMLSDEMLARIDDIECMIEDLGYDSVAYTFKCLCCGKTTVICQDY